MRIVGVYLKANPAPWPAREVDFHRRYPKGPELVRRVRLALEIRVFEEAQIICLLPCSWGRGRVIDDFSDTLKQSLNLVGAALGKHGHAACGFVQVEHDGERWHNAHADDLVVGAIGVNLIAVIGRISMQQVDAVPLLCGGPLKSGSGARHPRAIAGKPNAIPATDDIENKARAGIAGIGPVASAWRAD